MNLVKTYIASSKIQGIGLFAGEFIPKGTKMWVLNQEFDMVKDQEDWDYIMSTIREEQRKYVKKICLF